MASAIAATPSERTVAIASFRLALPASSSAEARVSTRASAASFAGRRRARASATYPPMEKPARPEGEGSASRMDPTKSA